MHVRIALIGKSGAGKSEVSRRLSEAHGFAIVKTGAICRTISRLLFGNEDKSSTQRLDDVLTALDPSIFLKASLRDVELNQRLVVDSLRFADDANLVERLDFTTVRVVCDDDLRQARLAARGQQFDPERDGLHRSETELDTYDAQFEIANTGSLLALNSAVDALVRSLQ